MNKMQEIRIEKLTLNVGAGKDQGKLEKGLKLIKHLTGREGVKTITQKRIPGWSLRPGLPIGCKLTLRDKDLIKSLLAKIIASKNNSLKAKQFDTGGNLSIGIHEYIDIPDINYDPDIGILGFEICITLQRPGFRIKKRKLQKKKVPKKHRITKDQAISFMEKEFQVKIEAN
jgi:large subunit ribosomal protein L5